MTSPKRAGGTGVFSHAPKRETKANLHSVMWTVGQGGGKQEAVVNGGATLDPDPLSDSTRNCLTQVSRAVYLPPVVLDLVPNRFDGNVKVQCSIFDTIVGRVPTNEVPQFAVRT